jgi:PhnB protein
MPVNHIPEGYHSVIPYLVVDGASEAIDFYTKAFGAVEVMRMPGPGGRIGHAEIRIGDSHVMLADEHPEMGYVGPKTIGGSPVSIMIYVPDVDARFKAAIDLGAIELKPLEDQFYGDRLGGVTDPFGHTWMIATHMEDVDPEEMARRAEKAGG